MRRKILIFLLTMILVLNAVPQGTQLFATTEASTSTVITKVPVTARNKQHSNINKKKKRIWCLLEHRCIRNEKTL